VLERFEESRKERLLTIELVTDGVEVMMCVCACVCVCYDRERISKEQGKERRIEDARVAKRQERKCHSKNPSP